MVLTWGVGTCQGGRQCQNVLGERPVWVSGVREVGKVLDGMGPAPTDFTPLKGEDSGLPDEVQPAPAGTLTREWVCRHPRLAEAPAWPDAFSGNLQPPGSRSPEKSSAQTGLTRRRPGGCGRARLSGQIRAQDLWRREDGGPQKVTPWTEVRLGRARGSHLVGPNGGRKEASEVGKRLVGPPLLQEGDLGTGEGFRAKQGPSVPLRPCS